MEIIITRFFNEAETFEFSASRAERGENAGPETWRNAMTEAASKPLLVTEEELQALRDHVQGMGFGHEVQTYDAVQCNALFIQLISGDMREVEGLATDDSGDIDWTAYEALSQEGTISGLMFKGTDGEIYYQLES
jgi:hypothetical protein